MERLSALLLSAALLLGAVSAPGSDSGAVGKFGSFLARIFQTASAFATEEPALPSNTATVKTAANLYSSYNRNTPTLAKLRQGDRLHVLCKAVFSSTEWVYVSAADYNLCGWVVASEVTLPDVVENITLDSGEISEEYIPAYAKMGIVTANQLNIRTAPGTGFHQVSTYRVGDRVGIIETNNGWGRTAKGWIYMDYVYLDGQVGKNPLVGSVTADLLNVRSGPGTDFTVCGSYRKGERLLVLEQVYHNGGYWGCTRLGWVSMKYIQADCIPGTNTPIYGYGTVKDDVLYVYPTAGTDYAPVSQIPKGSVIPILEVAKVGEVYWGHITTGWVNITNVDMRAIFEQTIIPAPPILPVTPVVPPTEPPTTEPPTTEPPTTEPPTTEPPTTEPPTTEPPTTEPPTTEPPTTEPPTTEPPTTEPPTTEPPTTEPPTTEPPTTEPPTTEATGEAQSES